MKISLSHIAIASSQIDAVTSQLKSLWLTPEPTQEVPSEKVNVAMVPVAVSPHFRIELLEPSGSNSPIGKFLEKRPNGGLHHLCFEVENLIEWEKRLTEAGVEVLAPGIRKAVRGNALFIHPKCMGGVLVELEEPVGE